MRAQGIAVFYHCIISNGEREINQEYAINLIIDQMNALKMSGLEEAAASITVGVNGDESDAMTVAMLCPSKSAVVSHGKDARTEIPTMNLLRDWAQSHPGWYCLYHHTKGVSTPNQADNWRRRMELFNVWNWRQCVDALDSGSECCGCHWLTPEENPGVISSPFFGGTFWHATTDYINTLPPLPPAVWANRYEAEAWIGKGPRRARVTDFCPGWPTP